MFLGNITLPDGYSSILHPIQSAIPPENIHLKHPVKLIRWKSFNTTDASDSDDSDRTVCEEINDYNIEVVCENGIKFYADHLICTIPLGVLKHKVNTLFQPPLPEYKLEAIEKLLFGTVDKILLEYERPFLHPSITEVLLLWENQQDTTKDLNTMWYKKIYSFSKVSDTLILGWISGKEAEYMESLSNDVISETCTMILRKFLNDPFIPKPKKCVWYNAVRIFFEIF